MEKPKGNGNEVNKPNIKLLAEALIEVESNMKKDEKNNEGLVV